MEEPGKMSGASLLPISNMPGPATVAMKETAPDRKPKPMTRRGTMVALSYMVCAVLLVMFNKAALSGYKFPCANVITVLQMIVSTALLYVLRKLDIIKFTDDGPDKAAFKRFVPLRILRETSPLSIAYLFYMVVGMASIRGVSVPMYTTLRRTTVLFTMIMEFFLVGQRHTTPIITSVAIIVFGVFIAGSRDFSFELGGYSLVFLSNLTTAIYLATIARLGKTIGLNSFGLMWCNGMANIGTLISVLGIVVAFSLLVPFSTSRAIAHLGDYLSILNDFVGIICGPLLFAWIVLSGELNTALHFESIHVLSFQIVIALSCMMAFCLNYTIFLNTTLNSALTQTMCGNLKDLGTVLIGWVWFGGLPFDWLNVLGQLLGFVGSGMYAYCKLKGK